MFGDALLNFEKNYLWVLGAFTIVYQLSFFAVAFTFRFDKVTDFAGGTNFVILAFISYFLGQPNDTRAYLASMCVLAWGARLSGFLLYRILKTEEDTRFDDMRNDFFKFLGFWIFQMAWVWTVSLPVSVTNSVGNFVAAPVFGSFTDFLGLAMFVVGLLTETVADSQKFAFRESSPKPLDILRSGAWQYSRHPNYFGEILLWWGIYLLCLPVTSLTGVYAVASPLFTTWLLLFVSGIPLSDPAKEKKFIEAGEQATYQEYIDSTSPVIPLPNDFYRSLPGFLKSSLLLDFPMYRYKGIKSE